MVDGIGAGGAGRAALEAALQRMKSRTAEAGLGNPVAADPRAAGQAGPDFAQSLTAGLREVDASVRTADRLPMQVANGELDFHEVAAQIKQSELSFQFAMQVRNKFVDAYREVMRMTV